MKGKFKPRNLDIIFTKYYYISCIEIAWRILWVTQSQKNLSKVILFAAKWLKVPRSDSGSTKR